jgi:hypothetical protein
MLTDDFKDQRHHAQTQQASVSDDVKDLNSGEVQTMLGQQSLTDDTKAEDQAYRNSHQATDRGHTGSCPVEPGNNTNTEGYNLPFNNMDNVYNNHLGDNTQTRDDTIPQLQLPVDEQTVFLRELGETILNPGHLMSLSAASLSPIALEKLLHSGFLSILCQALCEMCANEMAKYSRSLITASVSTEYRAGTSGLSTQENNEGVHF